MKIDKIYNLDAISFLKNKVDDNSVDLVLIDPPYNLKKADWDSFKSHQDFLDFTFEYLDLLIPKLKKTGSLYIFNTPCKKNQESSLYPNSFTFWMLLVFLISSPRKLI